MNEVLLEQVLSSIHNYFKREVRSVSDCRIEGGALSLDVPNGVWYRIQGSLLNDGMHQAGSEEVLADETFDGTITICAIPKPVLAIVEEIEAWQEKYGETMNSPYQSESFGGYSYSKRGYGTGSGANASPTGWQAEFGSRLNQWRKLS